MKKKIGVLTVIALTMLAAFFTTGMTPKKEDIDFAADYCYLVDNDSGRVLIEKGADEKRPIASMVKIMTLLLTFESADEGKIGYDDMVTISHEAASQTGSEMFLDENEQYSVSDIIKGIVTMSANDGSVAIAEHVGGSAGGFVERMNERAKELGMNNTLYANPTGLPTVEEQYSTAKDVTTVMRELIKHKKYYEYSGIWLEDYRHPSGRVTQLANTNKLIRHYKGCDSGKTGYTDSARYCLSASATRGGMRVVGTVMGANDSKSRFKSMSDMFNHAFNNYKRHVYLSADSPLSQEIRVVGGKADSIAPIIERDLAILKGRGEADCEVVYNISESVKAPIAQGQELGSVSLVRDGKVLMSVKVLASQNVERKSLWDIIKDLM